MELRVEVKKFRPQNLEEVMGITKLEEFRLRMMGNLIRTNRGGYGGLKWNPTRGQIPVKPNSQQISYP